MKYTIMSLIAVVVFWANASEAAYSFMSFKIRELGPKQYDYSFVWNPVTEEANLRLGLVLVKADPVLVDQELRFSLAEGVSYTATDVPELLEGCETVVHSQFDYQPGLPSYLMFVTLKGSNCQRVAKLFDDLQIRMHFAGVAISATEKSNLVLDISR